MKPWLKWTLIGLVMLVIAVLQFIPGESSAAPGSALLETPGKSDA